MKKALLPALALALLLTGCGAPKQVPAASEAPTETEAPTEPETEPETTPPKPFTERISELKNLSGTAVFLDETDSLDDQTAATYQAALQELADSREICTAAVITGSLAGIEPERFAEKYYRALFDDAEGFLLLINNDTGTDCFYVTPTVTIADTGLHIAQATPYLVEQNYPAALDILLPAGDDILITEPTEEPELSQPEA